jgi:hypothetical protein
MDRYILLGSAGLEVRIYKGHQIRKLFSRLLQLKASP